MADSPGDRPQAEGHAAGAYADPGSAGAAVSRSRFLTGATLGLGGIIGAAVAVPVVGFAVGPAFAGEDWYWTDLGPVDNSKWVEDKFVTVVFNRKPGNNRLDRRVVFVRRTKGGDVNDENTWTLVSNTCMHLGCPVKAGIGGFACPCHGGLYDSEGKVIGGPPARPLNRYQHKVENGHLLVGRVFATKLQGGKVVMTDIYKHPGQATNGLLSYLYPPAPR